MKRAAVLACLLATTSARADSTEDARRYFDAGRQAYEAGQYTVAVAAFEEANKLSPRAPITFALAQAYRRQYSIDRDGGKLVRAGALYRQYLAEVKQGERREEATRLLGEIEPLLIRIDEERAQAAAPAPAAPAAPVATQIMISSQTKGSRGSVDGGGLSDIPVIADVKPGPHKVHIEADGYFAADAQAVAVDGRLVVAELQLREKPASLAIAAPDGADIAVDGKLAGTAPLHHTIEVPAGKHYVAVSMRGHTSWSKEIAVGRGESATLTTSLARTNQRRIAFVVLGGAGAIALAGGVTTAFDLSARSGANDLAAKIEAGNGTSADLAEHNRLAARAGDYATASRVLFGGAAGVALAGALLYYFDVPRMERGALVPTASSGGFGAAWVTSF